MHAFASPAPPPGFKHLCNEGETCHAGGASIVAYGAKGIYSYRALCGTFICQKETYPRYIETGIENACFVPLKSDAINKKKKPKEPQDKCYAGAVLVNETVDCKGKKIGLSCNGDDEYQSPVMILINSTVKNVVVSKEGGSDGIHCVKGNCVLENVVWEDICEDAATMYAEGGTLTIKGGEAFNSPDGPGGKPDKIFQANAQTGKVIVTGGFVAKGVHGKLWVSCGSCFLNGGPRSLLVDDVIIDGEITSSVVGVNSNFGDVAEIKNLKITNYQEGKPRICVEYEGGTKKRTGVNAVKIAAKKKGPAWNSKSCKVKKSDISVYKGKEKIEN